MYRVYHAPPAREKALQHLNLAAGVLSGSRSARLDRRLVYDKGLATNVSSVVFESELSSLFLVIATVKPGVEPAAVEHGDRRRAR